MSIFFDVPEVVAEEVAEENEGAEAESEELEADEDTGPNEFLTSFSAIMT